MNSPCHPTLFFLFSFSSWSATFATWTNGKKNNQKKNLKSCLLLEVRLLIIWTIEKHPTSNHIKLVGYMTNISQFELFFFSCGKDDVLHQLFPNSFGLVSRLCPYWVDAPQKTALSKQTPKMATSFSIKAACLIVPKT